MHFFLCSILRGCSVWKRHEVHFEEAKASLCMFSELFAQETANGRSMWIGRQNVQTHLQAIEKAVQKK